MAKEFSVLETLALIKAGYNKKEIKAMAEAYEEPAEDTAKESAKPEPEKEPELPTKRSFWGFFDRWK